MPRRTSTERCLGAAVVFGANGFIGSHLGRALRLAGYPMMPCASEATPPPQDTQTVYFMAGRVTPSVAAHHPEGVAAEVEAFRRVLGSVQCRSRPPRVVLASSGGTVYAPSCRPPYREDHPTAPNNTYGLMKLEMESILRAQAGVEPVIVRLANVYGPGQQARRGLGVIAHWIDALGRGQPIALHGHLDTTRDYLYIDDVIDLLVRIHAARDLPQILNAGSGTPTALAELARLTLETSGRPDLPIRRAPARAADRMHVWLDIGLARSTLGWAPRTSLREGLRRTWACAATSTPTVA
jgi:UDP-glucose 4-epimerase